MKNLIINLFAVLVLTILAFSCQKNTTQSTTTLKGVLKDSAIISVNNCKSLIKNSITICLDSVWDSRCPLLSCCIWEGVASARFKVNFNNNNHTIYLATNNILEFSTDTTIDNITFHLADILPNPNINVVNNYSDYTAKVIIKN
jgi:hypothetical protein